METTTNIGVYYHLIDSTVNVIVKQLPDSVKTINLNLNFSSNYDIFRNRFIMRFNSCGIKQSDKNFWKVDIAIDNAGVSYSDIFRKSLFGSFAVKRTVSLGGNYIIVGAITKSDNFNFENRDTIDVNDVNKIENPAYQFAQSQLPAEPFLSNLYEPIIAVSAAAVAVFLFFTIRSK